MLSRRRTIKPALIKEGRAGEFPYLRQPDPRDRALLFERQVGPATVAVATLELRDLADCDQEEEEGREGDQSDEVGLERGDHQGRENEQENRLALAEPDWIGRAAVGAGLVGIRGRRLLEIVEPEDLRRPFVIFGVHLERGSINVRRNAVREQFRAVLFSLFDALVDADGEQGDSL
jgi:hypothetical protein